MTLIRFLLIFISFLLGSLQAYDTADVRFEIEKGFGKRLTIKAFERSTQLFSQTVDTAFRSTVIFGQNSLSRYGNGYKIIYKGRDDTSLSLEVDEDGNISLQGAGKHTGFEIKKSWGFKTPGRIRHQGSSLFYNLLTHAKEFQNYGFLKSYTGQFLQSYLFNRGIIHFGDETAFVSPTAYQDYLLLLGSASQPAYHAGIIDDHGVILADQGLKITGLTHRIHGLLDVGQRGLELKDASIDNRKGLNVNGPIRGTLNHFNNQGVFTADSLHSRDLNIKSWTNSGEVYLSQESDIYAQEKWNNSGAIHIRGNATFRSRKKPDALGIVISDGVIKALIDEAFDEASSKVLFAKAAFCSAKRKVVLTKNHHTDHYLNTITDHYTIDRLGRKTYTHTTETGDVFQKRTTERVPTEVELEGLETPAEIKQLTQNLQGQQSFLRALKQSLKEKLKQLGLININHNGILASLMKGLKAAGLSDEELSEIFTKGGIEGFIDLAAAYEYLSPDDRQQLARDLPQTVSFLNSISLQAQRLGLPLWQWTQRNGLEFVEGFCNTVIFASRYTAHPAIAVPARLCTFGQMAPKAIQNLQKAQTFFSKKYEKAGKSNTYESQRVVNPLKAESLVWRDLKPYKGDIKTNSSAGKEKRFYQWDHLHNEIEMYDRHGKPIDVLDPKTGARLFKDVKKHKPLKL